MSRKIKFRVWDIKNKKMEIAWSIDFAGKNYKSIEANEVHTGEYILGVDTQAILMQYTGLKDVNGVEICEGDIIKKHFEYEDEIETINDIRNLPSYDLSKSEVIGNVYESKHLINNIDIKELNI